MIRILFGLLVFASCGLAQASPLVYFTLEGRRQGSNDAFASSVEVALGDLVEYRLQVSMAPPGTQNQHLGQDGFSPAYRHGVNSLSIAMFQNPADAIQTDFGTPVVLTPDSERLRGHGWNAGVGADGGRLTMRPGTQWRDIPEIRPIQGAGVFTGEDQQTIYTGTLSIAAIAGDFGSILPKWGPDAGAGSLYGRGFFITRRGGIRNDGMIMPGSEIGADPVAHFTPLTFTAGSFQTVPEPSTLGLVGAALIGLLIVRLSRSRAAAWDM